MNPYPPALDVMLHIWNLTDHNDLRVMLEDTFTPDVEFIDPTIVTRGIVEFEQNVRRFRAKHPDAILRKTSGIDSHHDLHRYSWDIMISGSLLVVGYDVAETDAGGKIRRVLGFFGPLPPAP